MCNELITIICTQYKDRCFSIKNSMNGVFKKYKCNKNEKIHKK